MSVLGVGYVYLHRLTNPYRFSPLWPNASHALIHEINNQRCCILSGPFWPVECTTSPERAGSDATKRGDGVVGGCPLTLSTVSVKWGHDHRRKRRRGGWGVGRCSLPLECFK